MKIKHIWYRIRQFGFSAFMYLAPLRQARVIQGAGSIYKIPEMIKKDGKKKVLVVTTPGFIRRRSLESFFQSLEEKQVEYSVFSEVQPDPTTDSIEKAVEVYKKEQCEAIIAIGGGSVIDCSKALGARIARPDKTLQQMQGLLKVMKKIPDIYAVPTTAGTGSEATAGAVITEGKSHYKFTILDLCLVPEYAVLDPELTVALPGEITAHTGMDSLTHAIEAYTNCFCSPKTRKKAEEAIKLIYENILQVYENGEDIKARENMLLASYYAGVAINSSFIGYVHAVAHGIGGLYGVTHGKANAVILPHMLEAFGEKVWKKLAKLSKVIGLPGKTEEEQAAAFIQVIRVMNEKLGIPSKIEELRREDFDELVKRAVKEGNPTYPVPVIWEEKHFWKFMEIIV